MTTLAGEPYDFGLIVSLAWVAIFLLLGILVRNGIPALRRYAVPSCMVGGILGLFAMNIGLKDLGAFAPNPEMLQMITWHMFSFTFIAFGLLSSFTMTKSDKAKAPKSTGPSVLRRGCWMGCLTVGNSSLQGAVAVACFALWNVMFGADVFVSAGAIASQAIAGGPGPAMSTAKVWENAGVPGMMSYALGFNAAGFIASIFVGVACTNWMIRKTGRNAGNYVVSKEEEYGMYQRENTPSGSKLTFMGNNVDTMSFVVGLMIVTYLLLYLIMYGISLVVPGAVMGMLWSIYYVIGMLLGVLVKMLFTKFDKDYLIDKGTVSRVNGFLLDFMGLAALLSVILGDITHVLGLIVVTSIFTIAATVVFLWYNCRTMKEYGPERFIGTLGNFTGTLTSGLVLLRILDPDFKSPVAIELATKGVFGIFLSLPTTIIILPFMHAQALSGGSWVPYCLGSLGFAILWQIIIKLPFWGLHDKVAKF